MVVFQGDQAGNDGKVVRGLGDTMNLKGGADVNRLSDNNPAVVKNAAGDGYESSCAKDPNLKKTVLLRIQKLYQELILQFLIQ